MKQEYNIELIEEYDYEEEWCFGGKVFKSQSSKSQDSFVVFSYC